MPYARNLTHANLYARPWYRNRRPIIPTICPGSMEQICTLRRPYQQCQFCYTWRPILGELDTIMRPHELIFYIGEHVWYGDREMEIRSIFSQSALVICLTDNSLWTVPINELTPNPHRLHTFPHPEPVTMRL